MPALVKRQVIDIHAHLVPSSCSSRQRPLRSRGIEVTDHAVEKFRRMLASVPDEGYAGCCEAIATMTVANGIGGITAPTLVAGSHDTGVTTESSRRLTASIPEAHFAEVSAAPGQCGGGGGREQFASRPLWLRLTLEIRGPFWPCAVRHR